MTKAPKIPKPFKPTKAHVEKKLKNAIILLNDIVKIKLSGHIGDVCVVAMRDMKKGEKIYADAIPHAFDLPYKRFKELRPEVAELLLFYWPNIINGAHFLYPVAKMTAFLIHDEEPNYDINRDELIKDVKAGEIITINKRLYKNWEKLFPWLKL